MNLQIKGKTAVVAASSRGLGRAVAEALAGEGVNLTICARNKEQIEETARQIKDKYKVEVLAAVCDVSKPSEIEEMKERVLQRFGSCHIVFANAGGPPAGKLSGFKSADFQKAIDLNLMSTINLVYAFLPKMAEQRWGRIIASTSTNVRYLLPQFPLSNISRVGIVPFIKTVALEYARYNITANILAPGDFLTESVKEGLERRAVREGKPYEEIIKIEADKIPAGFIGDPKEYGALTAFLSSQLASYVTGETFVIDGGKYAGVM